MHLPEGEEHLAGEEALCMLVHNLDKSIDKEYNHSIVDSTADNTVDTPAFAVDWLTWHYWHWYCCLVLFLLVTCLGFES